MTTESNAKLLAKRNGRDWSDMGDYERCDYLYAARKIIGTSHFVSETKAIAYYSRMTPASSNRNIRAEVLEKIDAGEIVIGAPALKPKQRLLIIDNGLRYGIESDD